MKIIDNKPLKSAINLDHYKHSNYLVAYAKKVSQDVYSKVVDSHRFINGLGDETEAQFSSVACIYTNQLDQAIPCSSGLMSFICELKKHMPDVDFLLPKSEVLSRREGLVVSLIAYRPGDIFALGEIGQYDPVILKEGWSSRFGGVTQNSMEYISTAPFLVCSPYIDNARYREDSRGASFKIAVDLNTAVRNAKKYLRTYSPLHTGTVMASSYTRLFRSKAEELQRTVNTMHRELIYGSDKIDKLVSALNDICTGKAARVMDSELEEFMAKYEQAKSEAREADNRSIKTTFVMVSRSGAVVTIPFASINISKRHIESSDQPVVYESVSDVPEDLMGATAVLDMVKAGEYVDGVGMRVDDRAYWVGA